MAASAAVGWIEDFRGLSIRGRAAAATGDRRRRNRGPLVLTGQTFWWLPLAALAIAAYINIANFMDGVNGISRFHGIPPGARTPRPGRDRPAWLMAGGAVLATAFLGFLPWNLSRGSVFLGDVGSYLLGASVAALAVAGFLSGVYVEYVLSPSLVYLADTGYTLLRRINAGERWYASHREHVYQRLTDVGFSHLQSAGTVTGCTAAVIVLGFSPPRRRCLLWCSAWREAWPCWRCTLLPRTDPALPAASEGHPGPGVVARPGGPAGEADTGVFYLV